MKINNKNLILISGARSSLGLEVKKQIEKLSVKYLVINTKSISLKKITNQTKLIKKKIIHFEKITFLNISSRIQPIDLIGEQKNHEIYENIMVNIFVPVIIINYLLSTSKKIYIINITSGAAKSMNNKLSLYSLSKKYIEFFLKFLSKENKKNFIFFKNFDPKIMKSYTHSLLLKKKIFRNSKNLKYTSVNHNAKKLIKIIKKI